MITSTDSHELPRLRPGDARAAVGGDEPTNFMPWLARNIDVLDATLNLDLRTLEKPGDELIEGTTSRLGSAASASTLSPRMQLDDPADAHVASLLGRDHAGSARGVALDYVNLDQLWTVSERVAVELDAAVGAEGPGAQP